MENNNQLITPEVIDQILADKAARVAIVSQSHYWFFHLYFSQYVKYPTADFQKDMFALTEDNETRMAVIVAFRGSAKSTIMTMSYPLWAVLGKMQKKCVVIISQTQQQVRSHFANLKRELEANELLKADLGPFQEESDEWGSYSIVIPRFNARLVAVSSEQSIRGIRHGAYRPDLIICDDVEDINAIKTKEGRDKIYEWLTGEINPLGDTGTKIIIVGNLLHEDSLLMRLKKSIEENQTDGVFREFPIMNEDKILWAGKFPTKTEVEALKRSIGNEKSWQREYMLQIIADEDQIVQREWIHYYDDLPEKTDDYRHTYTTIDLAISQSTAADYTAMITAHVFDSQENMKIYILPNIVNKRLDFSATVEQIKEISRLKFYNGRKPEIYIENVAYQLATIQHLNKQGFAVKGFKVAGNDKRSRLSSVSHMVQLGQVLFPRKGAEELIQQLVHFGVEKHDDLVDAFAMLLLVATDNDHGKVKIQPRWMYDAITGGGSSYGGGYNYWAGQNPPGIKTTI